MQTAFGKNALIALAYLKSEDSPVKSISQLMYYCMTQVADNTFSLEGVRQAMRGICRLELPVGIIKICLNELCKTKHINYNKNEKCYTLLDNKDFDLSQFETKLSIYNTAEASVLATFCDYVKNTYNLNWSQDTARSAIEEFLTCGENAVSIFLGDKITESEDFAPDVRKSWYFASYLQSVKTNSTIMGYVQDLAYGYAKCIGLLGSADKDGNININQGFAGTEFYLDTKLILRFLGYSYDSEVQAAKELVGYIRKAGGLTRVFYRTLSEIGSALYGAALTIKNGHAVIDDAEMGFYTSDASRATDLLSKFGNSRQLDLLQDLLQQKGFVTMGEDDARWGDKHINRNNIDVTKLEKHIADANPRWNPRGIENDVDAINRINRLRGGNYTTYFGGKRKLPVFVTSNYFLIRDVALYAKIADSSVNWGHMCLPLISDSLLTYNIWIKSERNGLNIENTVLSKMTFALNHSSSNFKAKLIEETRRLQAVSPEEVPFILETAHIETVYEVIKAAVSATQGDAENLTPEIIIASENEAIKNRTYLQQIENEVLLTENERLRAEQQQVQATLDKEREDNKLREIENFVERYEFDIPQYQTKTFLVKCLTIALSVVGIILAVASSIIGYVLQEQIPGIIVSVLLVIGTLVVNFLVPRYKAWINRLSLNLFRRRLEKHIQRTNAEISSKTKYCDVVLVKIRKSAYLRYDSKEECPIYFTEYTPHPAGHSG